MKFLAGIILACVAFSAHAIEITAGGTAARNSSGEQKWLTFQRTVEQNTGGAVKVKMLIYGELGAEENLVAGIRRGRVHVANWSGAIGTTVVPELAILYAPYLFDDFAEGDFVMDNYLTEAYTKLLAAKDIAFLSWDEIGFSKVWSKAPIFTPDDTKGKRFRVSANEASKLFAESIGADVIPLAFSDIISSLQTGLIEAGETGAVLYVRTGIAKAAPHITNTDHNYATSIIVLRKAFMDGLPADQRKAITEAWMPIRESRRVIRGEVASDLSQAKERGFTVHDITPAQRDQWRKATATVTKKLLETSGPDAQRIWDLAQEGKKAYAAQRAK